MSSCFSYAFANSGFVSGAAWLALDVLLLAVVFGVGISDFFFGAAFDVIRSCHPLPAMLRVAPVSISIELEVGGVAVTEGFGDVDRIGT